MTNKLSLSQIDNAVMIEDELVDIFDDEVDEGSYRTSFQRKELRTNRKREDGELVGKGSIHKHRKY